MGFRLTKGLGCKVFGLGLDQELFGFKVGVLVLSRDYMDLRNNRYGMCSDWENSSHHRFSPWEPPKHPTLYSLLNFVPDYYRRAGVWGIDWGPNSPYRSLYPKHRLLNCGLKVWLCNIGSSRLLRFRFRTCGLGSNV